MKYNHFIFKDYRFDVAGKTLFLHYSLDNKLNFTETFHFDFDFEKYDEALLDRAIQGLFFMAGVSYYKTYLPPEIVVERGDLDQEMADFFAKTYQKGLGEFFYINKLDPSTPVVFPVNSEKPASLEAKVLPDGLLVGIGGGKDSLVSVELLRDQPKIVTWSMNHQDKLGPLIQKINLPHYWVERQWDRQLLQLNQAGAYNGHVPISAVLACVGTIVALLGGRRDAVVSNETSANEPTLEYRGLMINHQYSKSLEFERDYQAYLLHTLGEVTRYYSFLRPLTEVRIAEIFAHTGFGRYKTTFSSCNRAFVHTSHHLSWCGICAKCAFVFLALTPFVEREELEALFNGRNLLLDPNLEVMYGSLLGIEGDKPLDCVGEIKESRAAMRLAQQQYPELAKYKFDIPDDYDYKALSAHSMPAEIYDILTGKIKELEL